MHYPFLKCGILDCVGLPPGASKELARQLLPIPSIPHLCWLGLLGVSVKWDLERFPSLSSTLYTCIMAMPSFCTCGLSKGREQSICEAQVEWRESGALRATPHH